MDSRKKHLRAKKVAQIKNKIKDKNYSRKRDFELFLHDVKNYVKKSEFIKRTAPTVILVLIAAVRLFFKDSLGEEEKSLLEFFLVVVGIILTLVEIGDTRRLQEADFLVTLNQTFVENETYTKIYDFLESKRYKTDDYKNIKLKSSEVSQYLTFFETLYVLVKEQAVTIDDFDDLFGYRFFLAVYDDDIRQLKLRHYNNFINIYDLEERWFNYRVDRGKPILGKYYKVTDKSGLQKYKEEIDSKRYNNMYLRSCNSDDLEEILNFQDEIFYSIDHEDWLRKNDKEMFNKCLTKPNITFGLFDNNDDFIALSIMYASKDDEDLSRSLKKHNVEKSANFKLIIVKKEFRGISIMKSLLWQVERYAYSQGYTHLCATTSKDNIYSIDNLEDCGFEYDSSQIKYGNLQRDIYVKDIRNDQQKHKQNVLLRLDKKTPISKTRCFKGNIDIVNTGDLIETKDRFGYVIENNVYFDENTIVPLEKLDSKNQVWINTERYLND